MIRASTPCSSTTRTPPPSRPISRRYCAAWLARTLFTVVHEQFFTDTADYADILLPATTFLEHKDMQGAYGHYYVQISNQAIEPLGEARSNVWLFSELAQRMGFSEACFRDTPDDLIAQALREGGEQPVWHGGNDCAGSRRRRRPHSSEI